MLLRLGLPAGFLTCLRCRGLGCAFIVPDHLVNYHPFCTSTQYIPPQTDDSLEPSQESAHERLSKWIIPDGPLLGPTVYSAYKTIPVASESRASAQKLHALAVRERGDQASTKVLRFYVSWPTIAPFLHKWTAVFIKG